MAAVRFTLAARKALRGLPKSARADIEAQLHRESCLREGLEPGGGPLGGRLRSGAYRVIVRASGEGLEVVRAGHRKEIYQ